MIAATERQVWPVTLYKNTHLRILINGRIHIPAEEAARRASLSRDYISTLARRNVLPGNLLAGAWYLDLGSVLALIAQRAKNGSTKP